MAKPTAVFLFGSPRKSGNTAAACALLERALAKRFRVRRHDLYRMDFRGCAHCDGCKKDERGPACRLRDEFRPVLDEIAAARVIVVASPVYCWSVSGCMSAALDRLYCCFKASGKSLLAKKKFLGVFTAGGDAFDGMDLCVAMLQRLCQYGQAEYCGTLAAVECATPKDVARRKELARAARGFVHAL
ncbi:MAG: flavodoxin family protein [Myxococcales bacterium]|nr:flavodoxin family protein [Myxococcales bacterium]